MKDSFKEFIYHSMIWEELGFTYVGPVDGHDIRATVQALRQAAEVDGPVFVHVVTRKGNGYDPALTDIERSPRGQRTRSPRRHCQAGAAEVPGRIREYAGGALAENRSTRIIAITAAMPTGTSLVKFAASISRSVLRCRNRGAARRHVCRRSGHRGLATGRGHLLHVPPARLRPDHPRCLHPEAAGGVRAGSRRIRRRRRSHPSRRVRSQLPPMHPEHDNHGAEGRKRVAEHGRHRHRLHGGSNRNSLPARRRGRCCHQ